MTRTQIKRSTTPKVDRGFYSACEDIELAVKTRRMATQCKPDKRTTCVAATEIPASAVRVMLAYSTKSASDIQVLKKIDITDRPFQIPALPDPAY